MLYMKIHISIHRVLKRVTYIHTCYIYIYMYVGCIALAFGSPLGPCCCLSIAIDCLSISLVAHMFSANEYGPGAGPIFISAELMRIKGNR